MPRGLILVPKPGDEYREDFAAIAANIRSLDPGLQVRTVHEAAPAPGLADEFQGMPTLTVSFRHGVPFPVHGRALACRFVPKFEQVRRYAAAGIPFPRSRVFQWNVALDPARWGPYVVLKPMRLGTMSHGGIHLVPTSRVGDLTPADFPARHPIHHGPMLLQSFIDTGERPTSYRVLMLLGEPLYAMAIVLKQQRPDLYVLPPDFLSIVVASNAGPRDRIMTEDPEILAFARRMYKALPEVPLQGLDILRDAHDGRLYAIESNPGGNTWHFSSRLAAKMREEMGNGREILLAQFGAHEAAARALVRAATSD